MAKRKKQKTDHQLIEENEQLKAFVKKLEKKVDSSAKGKTKQLKESERKLFNSVLLGNLIKYRENGVKLSEAIIDAYNDASCALSIFRKIEENRENEK